MILLQYIILFLLTLASPLFPPIVIPFTYSMLAALLLQGADPWVLTIVTIIGGTISCVATWFLRDKAIIRLAHYQKAYPTSLLTKVIQKAEAFLTSSKHINSYTEKIEAYAKKPHGKIVFTLIVVFLVQSSVPDVIVIRLLRNKVSLTFFTITAALGKAVVYVPFIFLGTTALALVKHRLGR